MGDAAHISIDPDHDAAVRAWREGAMHVVVRVLAAAGLPVVVSGLLGTFFLPWKQVWIGVGCYAALLTAVFVPRRFTVARAVLLFSSGFLFAIEQMAANGLSGSGRISLLMIPLVAVILLGARGGWIAASVSASLVAGFAVRAWTADLANPPQAGAAHYEGLYWLLQALLFVVALSAMMVLLTRFMSLQMQTMLAERLARLRLERESARRRRLEAEAIRVSEEERRRVGSELHDGLCQQLTAALLYCTVVENQMAEGETLEAGRVNRLRAMIEDSIGTAYDASKGLCPLDLTPDSLVFALERLARQTQASTGVACEFLHHAEGGVRDHQQALHLFRIAQEAVTNAVKHAQCHTIRIELERAPDSVTLIVEDDGRGRGDDGGTDVGGMGMQLMAFRAEAVGGTLTVGDRRGGGTVVSCRVPAAQGREERV